MNYKIVQIYKKFYVKKEVHIPLLGKRWLFIRYNFLFRYSFNHTLDAEKFVGEYHTGAVKKERTIKQISL